MPRISPWAADMEGITSHSKLGHFVQRQAALLCGHTVYWTSYYETTMARGCAGRMNQSCRYFVLSGGEHFGPHIHYLEK